MTIEALNLSFEYPNAGFRLSEVNFVVGSVETVQPGEIVALTGPNGSGKTTLGKLLCGLLKPQSGAVLFGGEDTAGWSLGRRGQSVGYLFQEPARQLFAPTALEDLTFTQELAGVPPEVAAARALELLARFELAPLARRGTLTLSRGEQQRLAICGLLLNKPGALVLDEPTTGLDARRKEILADTMRECLAGGVSVLLISHDMAFVRANAQREVRMEDLAKAPFACEGGARRAGGANETH